MAIDAKLKSKLYRRSETQRVRACACHVGGDGKTAASAGVHQSVDVGRGDVRQVRRENDHFLAAESAQQPMGMSKRTVQRLSSVGQYRYIRGHELSLWADDNDLPYYARIGRSRKHRRQHRAHQSQARPRRHCRCKARFAARPFVYGNKNADSAAFFKSVRQIAKCRKPHRGLPASTQYPRIILVVSIPPGRFDVWVNLIVMVSSSHWQHPPNQEGGASGRLGIMCGIVPLLGADPWSLSD